MQHPAILIKDAEGFDTDSGEEEHADQRREEQSEDQEGQRPLVRGPREASHDSGNDRSSDYGIEDEWVRLAGQSYRVRRLLDARREPGLRLADDSALGRAFSG